MRSTKAFFYKDLPRDSFLRKKWYFNSKRDLTFFEKKKIAVIKKTFEDSRLKA